VEELFILAGRALSLRQAEMRWKARKRYEYREERMGLSGSTKKNKI
jgi:hypothetical protein